MDNEDFEKNSVKAEGQSDTFRIVEVFPKQDAALKVLFVGNSITRHGVKVLMLKFAKLYRQTD